MSSSVELIPITDPQSVWILAKPLIQKVIDRFGGEDIELLYKDILAGDRQLWMVLKDGEVVASVLTMIQEYHGKRTGTLTHAGGQGADEWFHIVNPIGDYFKAEGCETFQIIGRKGWLKYLPEFKTDRIIMEKKING